MNSYLERIRMSGKKRKHPREAKSHDDVPMRTIEYLELSLVLMASQGFAYVCA